jgi:hypothetical protein
MISRHHYSYPQSLLRLGLLMLMTGCSSSPYHRVYQSLLDPETQHLHPRCSAPAAVSSELIADKTKLTLDTCQTVLVQSAINECIAGANVAGLLQAGEWSMIGGELINSGVQVVSGVISTVGVASEGPLAATTAVASTAGAFLSSLGQTFSGKSTTLVMSDFYDAATAYINHTKCLQHDEAYFQGLWNAIGAACPKNPLKSGFPMVKTLIQYRLDASNCPNELESTEKP